MPFGRNRSTGSLRIRLIALFVGIFGFILVVFSFFLYRSIENNHEADFDIALYNYSIDVVQSVKVNLLGEITLTPDILSASEKVFPFALGETFLQVRLLDGTSIARSSSLRDGSLPMTRSDRDALLVARMLFRTVPGQSIQASLSPRADYRLLMLLVDRPRGSDLVFQVAVPMVLITHERRGLVTFFLFSIPSVLALASLGGLYLSRKALQPFNAILEKVNRISPDQLSERVPVPDGRDEIHRLAVTLNDLLGRIESAFRSQETFIADASHQLKTPLAIMRGELDVFRSKERSPEEMQAFLTSAAQEISQLSRLVENLLLMARIDAGAAALAKTRVRLDEVAMEVVSRFETLARTRGVRLVLNLLSEESAPETASFEVKGDSGLLRILIENLVDNALKYSSRDSVVMLDIRDRGDTVEGRVRDHGLGISPEALPRIFERFFRADGARRVEGAGLGLAIAKRIVDIQDGSIDVRSSVGQGTEFRFEFSKDSSSSET